jgi:oxygen-independent coproporphyrinogen-3 oxidase
MGLRLVDGVDLDIVETRYEIDVIGQYGSALRPFLDVGVLVEENRRLRLTRQGMLVANEIMSVFV